MRLAPALALASLVTACGGGSATSASGRSASRSASPAASGGISAPLGAHWVPRVGSARDAGLFYQPRPDRSPAVPTAMQASMEDRTIGSATQASVYLGKGRVGLVSGGRREVAVNGTLAPIADPAMLKLRAVACADGGDGCVFIDDDGESFVSLSFDGHLSKVTHGPQRIFLEGFAPHSAFFRNLGFVSLSDGALASGAPKIAEKIFFHASHRFAVTTDANGTAQYSTRDGVSWRQSPPAFRVIGDAGDDMLGHFYVARHDVVSGGHDHAYARLDEKGNVHPLFDGTNDAADEELVRRAEEGLPSTPFEARALDDGVEGALLDAGYLRVGGARMKGEWVGITRSTLRLASAGKLPRDLATVPFGCNLRKIVDDVVVECGTGDASTLSLIDLDTGKLTPAHPFAQERVFVVDTAQEQTWPRAVAFDHGCEGASPGYCVSATTGQWINLPNVQMEPDSLPLFFPGEVFALSHADAPDIVVSQSGVAVRKLTLHDAPAGYQFNFGVGAHGVEGKKSAYFVAALRVASGVRLFFNNDSSDSAGPHEYVVDVSLDPKAPLRLTTIAGVTAFAGLHALRIDHEGLYESDDGCATWHPAAPLPDGSPPLFEQVVCRDEGCVVGPWARVGWDDSN